LKRAKKSKVDMLGGVFLDVIEADLRFNEELSSITGIEFLLAVGIMNPDFDISDLVEFVRSIDQPLRMVFGQLLANGNEESDFLLTEVKNKLKTECPELYDYLEEIYGNDFECSGSVPCGSFLDDE
jgi:hypothetical protein